MPKLTDSYVNKLVPPEKGNIVYWDSGHKKAVPGFGVRITRAGHVAFVFNYRTKAGRARRMTIGDYSTYSTIAAREVAKKHRRTVDASGDPMAEQQSERDAPTVAGLCQLYLDTHAKSKREVSRLTDRYTIERVILPAMKHLTVAEVKYSHVAKLHRKISERAPYRANRVVALLSKMFGLAVKEGWREDNPTKGVERNLEIPRERYLSSDELVRLLDALAQHHDQEDANAVRLLMLTGARRGEVLGMRFDQIDFEKGTWTKLSAHTKQRKLHHVPLSAPALLILAEMRSRVLAEQVYVFPSHGKRGHRADLKKPWAAICKAAKITGLRLHDLRHSYASLLVAGGASLPMIGKLLGHTQAATTLRYAHLDVDPLREVTERVGAIIEGAGKPLAEVVEIRGKVGDIIH